MSKIFHVLLDFQLPPPIYGYELTTDPNRAERTIKLVRSIKAVEGGIVITAIEGQEYNIPLTRVQYWREE